MIAKTVRVLRRGPIVPAPFRNAWNHKPTFFAKLALERWIACGRSIDNRTRALAELRASSLIGCLW